VTPSPDRVRATRLFIGGLLGWHGGLALSVAVGFLIGGTVGLFSGLIGAALAVAYYAIGQGVQMLYADAPPKTLRVASIVSYAVRVAVMGALLYASTMWPALMAALDARGLFAGVILGVLGWLTGLVVMFRRLRVPVFDPPDLRDMTHP
jgi:hypothetical protein